MGRKNPASSLKSKEKRLQRKEEQMKIGMAMATVDKANKLDDPLGPFPVFQKYCQNGVEANLYVKRCAQLDESVKNWAFTLTKKNMQVNARPLPEWRNVTLDRFFRILLIYVFSEFLRFIYMLTVNFGISNE